MAAPSWCLHLGACRVQVALRRNQAAIDAAREVDFFADVKKSNGKYFFPGNPGLKGALLTSQRLQGLASSNVHCTFSRAMLLINATLDK
ncbi:hypothetical protein ACFS07_05665 [Undibacterium arcticum]